MVRKLWMLRQATARAIVREARRGGGSAHVRTSLVFRALLAAYIPSARIAAAIPKPSASSPRFQPSISSERNACSR